MKATEAKAMRLVLAGKVTLEHAVLADDGTVQEALGYVEGDTGTWQVKIDGDDTECNCPYGQARLDAHGHSHDLALRLAAQGNQPAKEEQA